MKDAGKSLAWAARLSGHDRGSCGGSEGAIVRLIETAHTGPYQPEEGIGVFGVVE